MAIPTQLRGKSGENISLPTICIVVPQWRDSLCTHLATPSTSKGFFLCVWATRKLIAHTLLSCPFESGTVREPLSSSWAKLRFPQWIFRLKCYNLLTRVYSYIICALGCRFNHGSQESHNNGLNQQEHQQHFHASIDLPIHGNPRFSLSLFLYLSLSRHMTQQQPGEQQQQPLPHAYPYMCRKINKSTPFDSNFHEKLQFPSIHRL